MQLEFFNFMSIAGMFKTGFRSVRMSEVKIPENLITTPGALVVEPFAGEI
jgi:hypothetical protein